VLPERVVLDGIEQKWAATWEADGTYRFQRGAERAEVFSIDTPPPTVSGALHVGHIFSYTHTDLIARYQRMRGKSVFYPLGFDDNGLATERRVQVHFGVACDPSRAYDPDFSAPSTPAKPPVMISRPNFVDLCRTLTAADERAFTDLFTRLGLSVDWGLHYTTIGERSQAASQASFLQLLAAGKAYRREAPTLWDVDFQTAVAQAELEDREVAGSYYRIRFDLGRRPRDGGKDASEDLGVEIETTRPELLPACVALVAHESDERYRHLFGSLATSPLFGIPIPILAHRLADPEKGSGIAMVCTFGDLTDVVWWRELDLPTRTIVGRDGRLLPLAFRPLSAESQGDRAESPGAASPTAASPTAASPTAEREAAVGSRDVGCAEQSYAELVGLRSGPARTKILELLAASGALIGPPRPITHMVNFYEKGDHPLEIVSSPQWYISTIERRQRLLDLGRELIWHPGFMAGRYASWVEGLHGDWNISRQRYFGVPFPIWYRLDDRGEVLTDQLLTAETSRLPVDPSTDCPTGFDESQRNEPGGFTADPDVMDTWATSSLTPVIAGHADDDPDLFSRVFPMDLRPQGHDIIRTWLFSSIVRSELSFGCLPFREVAISGWILDPDRKKMGKSKGNVVTPLPLLEEHGSDALRYWASSARLGADTAFDTQQIRIGRRLAIKVLNASRFALGRLVSAEDAELEIDLAPLDHALVHQLRATIETATAAFEAFDHARALEVTETFFWRFCDDYLELAKARSYGEISEPGTLSARKTLAISVSSLLRLFAPFLPFVTEEAWSWFEDGSIHRAPWPEIAPLEAATGPEADSPAPQLFDEVSEVLRAVRARKSGASVSLRAPVRRCRITGARQRLALIQLAEADLSAAGVIDEITYHPTDNLEGGHAPTADKTGGPLAVEVELEGEQA